MALSIREQILVAVVVALQTIPAVTVERNLETEAQVFPLLNVIEIDQDVDVSNHGVTEYIATLGIEGYVQTPARSDLGPANNDLYARVVQALHADHTLGGLAVDVTEIDSTYDVNRDGMIDPTAYFAVNFVIRYFTKPGDPYSVGP